MKHKILTLIILLSSIPMIFAQNESEIRRALNKISKTEEINKLKKKYPNWNIMSIKIPEIGFMYDSIIYNSEIGNVHVFQNKDDTLRRFVKILGKSSEEFCKLSYIYFDGKNKSVKEIDLIRTQIIKRYQSGESFIKLVQAFTEDGNPTGELDWFYEDLMVDGFYKAVKNKKKNDIFVVDIPELNWYYIILKSDENKKFKITYTVQIQEDK